MSANNQIIISQTAKKVFAVNEINMDSGKSTRYLGNTKTLEKAVRLAKDYEKELNEELMTVEYGIDIILKD